MKCTACKEGQLKPVTALHAVTVGGHEFSAKLKARRCTACQGTFFMGPLLQRMEARVAVALAESGEKSGEAMRFMRKALGLRATELAELMDVTAEHVSRWESGKVSIETRAMALLCAMVLDTRRKSTATLECLKALQKPKALPRHVKVEVTARA